MLAWSSLFHPRTAAIAVFVLAFATIAAAWGFQAAGYAPCELCLAQRIPYYIGVPLAGMLALAMPALPPVLARIGLLLLALLFIGSCIFGIYHAGVEWGFWQGPTACTGSFKASGDLLADIETTNVVRCDAVAIRIAGLSLAGWNGVMSAGLAGLAAVAGWRPERTADL